jgi:hypothetical protein
MSRRLCLMEISSCGSLKWKSERTCSHVIVLYHKSFLNNVLLIFCRTRRGLTLNYSTVASNVVDRSDDCHVDITDDRM